MAHTPRMPQQVALASRVEVYHMLNEMLGSVPMVRWRVTGLYPVVLNILQVYDVAPFAWALVEQRLPLAPIRDMLDFLPTDGAL